MPPPLTRIAASQTFRPFVDVLACPSEPVLGDGRLAPALAFPRRDSNEPGTRALLDQVALELVQRPEDVEHERPPGVVVLMASASGQNPTPRFAKSAMVPIR